MSSNFLGNFVLPRPALACSYSARMVCKARSLNACLSFVRFAATPHCPACTKLACTAYACCCSLAIILSSSAHPSCTCLGFWTSWSKNSNSTSVWHERGHPGWWVLLIFPQFRHWKYRFSSYLTFYQRFLISLIPSWPKCSLFPYFFSSLKPCSNQSVSDLAFNSRHLVLG